MLISNLRLENFRNIDNQDIDFAAGINLITGANGSGKTSLLEAIYYLGRAKSFRTKKYKDITAYGKDYFRIIARTKQPEHLIGIEKNNEQNIKLRIDREAQKSIIRLAQLVPSIAITSASFSIIDSAPSYRRQFIDYGSFHFDNNFHYSWKIYQRALKSRNSALKQKLAKQVINSFTPMIAEHGEIIHTIRKSYFKELKSLLSHHLQLLDFPYEITIRYNAGWNHKSSLLESLNLNLDYDYRVSHTRYGPHRADIKFTTDKGSAASFLSRGQQKTLIVALHLAQIDLISKYNSFTPLLLIDDISAELDEGRRNSLIEYLANKDCQIFLSATEKSFFSKQIIDLSRNIELKSGSIIS